MGRVLLCGLNPCCNLISETQFIFLSQSQHQLASGSHLGHSRCPQESGNRALLSPTTHHVVSGLHAACLHLPALLQHLGASSPHCELGLCQELSRKLHFCNSNSVASRTHPHRH